MSTSDGRCTGSTARLPRLMIGGMVLVGVFSFAAGISGTAEAAGRSATPATFDIFSDFPRQFVSPATGNKVTWIPVDTRNITDSSDQVVLSVHSDSAHVTAFVLPPRVTPSGREARVRSWVVAYVAPGTPEGTSAHIKVTGTRGTEQHRVWLKVTALSSRPTLELSRGPVLVGPGSIDQGIQPFTGKPVTWKLGATNHGAATDTYGLSYHADFPCRVRFLDSKGSEIRNVTVKGLTKNYLYPEAVELTAEVTPEIVLPKNMPKDIVITLGPGLLTGETSHVTVQVVNPGMLFCMNATDGLRPHSHQVMCGETTTFMFHISNLQAEQFDVTLKIEGDPAGWYVGLDRNLIKGLLPGETAQAILKAVAPSHASVGDSLDLTVSATSSLGAKDQAHVRAEITSVPNIYYWAIDSMNPEYLYLDRRDPGLGPIRPLTVINRNEMLDGVDYGLHGRIRPRELYSEYWITHPNEPGGHLWPDLFVFPLYNYNIAAHGQVLAGSINPVGVTVGNLPDSIPLGFPAAHGGLQTTDIPLIFKAPAWHAGYAPGTEYHGEVEVGDIAPTIYRILGWPVPGCVDGNPLPE